MPKICPDCGQYTVLFHECRPAEKSPVASLVPAQGSGAPLFDPRLLARCLMSKEDAAKFRQEARMDIVRDEETEARVVCYIHPDGRILIDAVRLPNTTVSERGHAASAD